MLKKKFLIGFFILLSFVLSGSFVSADEYEKTNLYMFGREGCHYCQLEKNFLDEYLLEKDNFDLVYFDIDESDNKEKFDKVVETFSLIKATPITLIGGYVLQGFESEDITGKQIISYIEDETLDRGLVFEDYLNNPDIVSLNQQGFCGEGEEGFCSIGSNITTEIDVPFLGVIDFKEFSLFSMSLILGFVDGFNPCAMWVLLTFLLVLWQINDKKKMWQVAGIFIFAEFVMYWLILNFWFSTWDFVGLDKYVTPAVGLLALGGGVYFLNRYRKNKDELVCDVGGDEYKTKTQNKIRDLLSSPMTLLTVLGIVGLAFSVNVIEFACSVGIPQTFTKILEMNNLSVFLNQFYILTYTLFYMVDDFVVFGLALYGFSKFYSVGTKYSNLSSLVGGVIMIILGILMLFVPEILIF